MSTSIYKYIIFCVFILLSLSTSSQIRFDLQKKDLGKISNNGDIIRVDFTFINESNKPIAISHISTTCGCTTTSFEKEPIPPHKKGKISVDFNPYGIKGYFNKQIQIFYSGEKTTTKLYISGNVLENKILKEGYNYNIGDILFRNIRTTLSGKKGITSMRVVPLANNSDHDIKIVLKSEIDGIFFDKNEFILKSKDETDLNIYYKPTNSKKINIRFKDGGKENEKVVLLLSEEK